MPRARISGSQLQDTEAGCCGMVAGSFGYEVEHACLSQAIAEQRLLSCLSKADNLTQTLSNVFYADTRLQT